MIISFIFNKQLILTWKGKEFLSIRSNSESVDYVSLANRLVDLENLVQEQNKMFMENLYSHPLIKAQNECKKFCKEGRKK